VQHLPNSTILDPADFIVPGADHDEALGVLWAESEDVVIRLLGLLNQQPAYRTFRPNSARLLPFCFRLR
jgi:hypothetical protein